MLLVRRSHNEHVCFLWTRRRSPQLAVHSSSEKLKIILPTAATEQTYMIVGRSVDSLANVGVVQDMAGHAQARQLVVQLGKSIELVFAKFVQCFSLVGFADGWLGSTLNLTKGVKQLLRKCGDENNGIACVGVVQETQRNIVFLAPVAMPFITIATGTDKADQPSLAVRLITSRVLARSGASRS